ncbi:hypothetical protein J7J90_00530 [Candidatus Micrarchaeota archaeon]|nr:hypothetical protein [Candidatus Micrarchaeota archaeon]
MLAMIEYETFNANTNEPIDKKVKLLVETDSNSFPKKVNDLIKNLSVNESGECIVKLPFGKRNKELVRVVSEKRFKDNKLRPVPGMVISLDGRPALVKSVSGSRVIVDLNHPLADKDIRYKIKLLKKAGDDPIDKAKLFLEFYNITGEIKTEGNKIIIKTDNSNIKKVKDISNMIKQSTGKDVVVTG